MSGGLKSYLLKLAGKGEFKLDDKIGFAYLLGICKKYGFMLMRGKLCALGFPKISNKLFIGKNVKLLCKKNVNIGAAVKLHDCVKIDALSTDGVVLEEGVVLGKNTSIECTGSLSCVGKGVKIGKRTTFGCDCFFGAAGGIEIGTDVIAGQYIRFHSENHNFNDTSVLIRKQGVSHKGIKVGNNCWIGSGVVFLDGAEIGNGCVVAANSVVTKKFLDNVVLGGVPAKIIKMRGQG